MTAGYARGTPKGLGPADLRTVLLLVAFGTLGGCTRLPASAVRRITEAHRAYQAGRYTQARQMVDPVIIEYGAKPDVGEALYLRGLSWLKLDKTPAARADFESGLGIADREDLRAVLHAQLGNLDYEAGRYENAIDHYRRAEPDLPSRPPSDRILARYAEGLQRLGSFREARKVHARLLLRFPHSPVAGEVRRRGSWAKDHYTIQCGVYSKSESARKAAAQLKAKGIDAGAWREERNGAVRHVVRAGRYRTHAEALRALPAVRNAVPDAFIVP